MAKYFVERLIAKNVNLDEVLPEQQKSAQIRNNVTYNLADVVMYMKDATENFKIKTAEFIDMDEAIREIMKRYYKSKNIPNPFELPEEQEEDFEGETPKEPLEVKDGKTTAKGAPKAAPVVKVEPAAAVGNLTDAQKEKIAGLENEMEELFGVFDLLDDEKRSSIIASITDRMKGEKDLLKDLLEENIDDDEKDYYEERLKIYSTYLNKYQNG
jgi:hypothetical protein